MRTRTHTSATSASAASLPLPPTSPVGTDKLSGPTLTSQEEVAPWGPGCEVCFEDTRNLGNRLSLTGPWTPCTRRLVLLKHHLTEAQGREGKQEGRKQPEL